MPPSSGGVRVGGTGNYALGRFEAPVTTAPRGSCKGREGASSFSRGSLEALGTLVLGAPVRGARNQAGGRFEVPGILLPRGSCKGCEGSRSGKVRGTRNNRS